MHTNTERTILQCRIDRANQISKTTTGHIKKYEGVSILFNGRRTFWKKHHGQRVDQAVQNAEKHRVPNLRPDPFEVLSTCNSPAI
jgi:hypothetical protein